MAEACVAEGGSILVAEGDGLDTIRNSEESFYWTYRQLREVQYKRHGQLYAVDRKPRFVIPPTGWKPPAALAKALRAISPRFEIIHDPLTRKCDEPPELGCHLYSIDKIGGVDFLILESSLQWDMGTSWPAGRPRAPGPWLVEWVKQNDKARMQGDKDEIDRDCCDQRVQYNDNSLKEQMRPIEEFANHVFEDVIDPMWNKSKRTLHVNRPRSTKR